MSGNTTTVPCVFNRTANGLAPPSTAQGGTLSANGLTFTSNGHSGTVFGSNPLDQGSYYFEITVTQSGTESFVGLAGMGPDCLSQTESFIASGGLGTFQFYTSGPGTIYGPGAGTNTGVTLGSFATGDVVCVAVSLPNLIWFRKNDGNWNNSSSADPATGVGGLSLATSPFAGPFAPLLDSEDSNSVLTANFGAVPFTFTPPSLFGDWPGIETLTITSVTVADGTPMALVGTAVNGVATALDYSIDEGNTWTACTDYTAEASWSAEGPTFTGAASGFVMVRDHTNQSIVSAPVAFSIDYTPPTYATIIYGPNDITVGTNPTGTQLNGGQFFGVTSSGSQDFLVVFDINVPTTQDINDGGLIGDPLAFSLSSSSDAEETDPSQISIHFDRKYDIQSQGEVIFRGAARIYIQNSVGTDPDGWWPFDYGCSSNITITGTITPSSGETASTMSISLLVNGSTVVSSGSVPAAMGALREFIIHADGYASTASYIAQFSNLTIYDETPPAEALVISTVAATGSNVQLTGTNAGTIAEAMDYSLDAGTWTPLVSFAPGTSWAGTGPVVLSGTHTIQVRDHNVQSVLSNTETFVIGLGVYIWDGIKINS